MELHLTAVVLLGLVAFATQDVGGKKGCDCSVCGGVDNSLGQVVGKSAGGSGKPGCSLCERKKEMLRLEREREARLQKCPFEILGSRNMKGKTSEEIYDQFRELVVPSQNGFFDMMRGVVKTMHVSTEAELRWAKEKEAREVARRKAEEARRQKEAKRDETVGLAKPQADPKVTVVVKQTPCGQVLRQDGLLQSKDLTLFKRLPKEAGAGAGAGAGAPSEEEAAGLQALGRDDSAAVDYLGLGSEENLLDSELGYQATESTSEATAHPSEAEEEAEGDQEDQENAGGEAARGPEPEYSEDGGPAASTESPFVKFMSHRELRARSKGGGHSGDDFGWAFDGLPPDTESGPRPDGGDVNHLLDPVFHDE